MSGHVSASQTAITPGTNSTATNISPELAQHVVDQAAYFSMFSMPDMNARGCSIMAADGSNLVIGMEVHEVLHRFSIRTEAPTAQRPLRASNVVGEAVGRFRHRWMLIPDDFRVMPDREPPPTALDLTRSQRFAMLDGLCTFGHGSDGFRGFGAGHTVPVSTKHGRQLLGVAIGTMLEGFGRFKGLEPGTYVYCGSLVPDRGFTGSVMLRIPDPEGTLTTETELPALEERPNPEPDVTYIMFRGQAVPSDPVTPKTGAAGDVVGVVVEQGLRLFENDFANSEARGLRSTVRLGPHIGKIIASIHPFQLGGTVLAPISFAVTEEMVFFDSLGHDRLGSFTADCNEGRQFATKILGQPAIRFGNVGQLLTGKGPFAGIQGLMTDNSLVVFSPHVSATVYTLRVYDPTGSFRLR